MQPSLPPVYPIIDAGLCQVRGISPADLAAACLAAGATFFQLRAKDAGSAELLRLADALQRLAVMHGAALIVNDRPDVASMCGAAGVHVGQDDLPVDVVRSLLRPEAIVGISTHTEPQVDEALLSQASYVAVGPVFDTATKATGYAARGLDLVRYAANRGKPVVAIGGVTLDNAASILAAGASSLAVITDLMSGDPGERVARYLRLA